MKLNKNKYDYIYNQLIKQVNSKNEKLITNYLKENFTNHTSLDNIKIIKSENENDNKNI